MSSYGSSESEQQQQQNNYFEKKPFEFDYYLSNSIDVFESWKSSLTASLAVPPASQRLRYLQLEFPFICRIDKFRTANIIRSNGFILLLQQAFAETHAQLLANFAPSAALTLQQRAERGRELEGELGQLLGYLEVVLDHGMQTFFKSEGEGEGGFEAALLETISRTYTFVTSPKLLWDLASTENQLVNSDLLNSDNPNLSSGKHPVSLGGNHPYYQNLLRSLLKRNPHLREVYDRLMLDLRGERPETRGESVFLVKAVVEGWGRAEVEEKERREFIDAMKGLYFLGVDLRGADVFHEYIFTSFHLEHLEAHRIFQDHVQLEEMYHRLLRQAKHNSDLMSLLYTLELHKLPFPKRRLVPQIELEMIDIVFNYIGVVKGLLDEAGVFEEVPRVSWENAYASSKYLLEHQSVNGLVGVLMCIQENSKEAFSQGGVEVHRVYIRMSELLKEIYLSYEHENWLFPPDILLYIPLRYFIEISDDIRADVKKTLFQMVNVLNEDRLPYRLVHRNGKPQRERVDRAEYLQVILYFLEECKREEEYINLPEIVPTNMETSILYVKSLESKLNMKEPNEDQKPYFKNMLDFCQNYKLTINFKWYDCPESAEDREIEFNIEKGLSEDWMRRIFRETINFRESEKIESYFDKYRHKKGLTVLAMANILKYNHGLNTTDSIPKNIIGEEDLFLLMDEIRTILSIHFDIFNLNLDEEISLNYLHVCLGFYNSNILEAPGNEIYTLIMEKIMVPYLRHPNSSLSKFSTKYPGFFANWIYSFQIATLLGELGSFIMEHAGDPALQKDILAKVRLVADFLDNRDNIEKSTSLEQLTETIVSFSTLLSPASDPDVYLEGTHLFCRFLNAFPAVRSEASLDFLLSPEVLSDSALVDCALARLKKDKDEEGPEGEVSILNGLVRNLAGYMNSIGLKKAFEVIATYIDIRKVSKDINLYSLAESVLKIREEDETFISAFLKYIVVLKKLSDNESADEQGAKKEETDKKEEELIRALLINLSKKFVELESQGKEQMEHVLFTEIVFLDDLVKQLDTRRAECSRDINSLARSIFQLLLRNHGKNEDFMYFAEKLNMSELILVGRNQELGQRQQDLLVDIIVENKHREIQTELIKRLLRENTRLSEVAERAIAKLSAQPEKVHSYHLNRFIQINNRYPKASIEQFLLQHIGCERNPTPAKINQRYLIHDLSKLLEKVPKKPCEELLLKPIRSEDREKLIEIISDIFEKLLYLPIKKFDKLSMKVVEEEPENEDWNTESDDEQQETKQSKSKRKEEKEPKSGEQSLEEPMEEEIQEHNSSDGSNMSNEEDYYDSDNRPEFLQIFTEEEKRDQLKLYSQIMTYREELDVAIDGNYDRLQPGSELLQEKEIAELLFNLCKCMNSIDPTFRVEMCYRMPTPLYTVLSQYGLEAVLDPEAQERFKKRREPTKTKPKWLYQFFSDREQSDDSSIIEQGDDYEVDDSDDDSDDRYSHDGGRLYYEDGEEECEDDDDEDGKARDFRNRKGEKRRHKKEELPELPELLPTYSKIEEEISGVELKREEIIKILEISLYLLLNMPESQIRTRHVTSFYMDILESNFGQMFLESFMTVIRFDETSKNLEHYLRELNSKGGRVEIGLQQISMEDAINNILYLIKEYEESDDKDGRESRGNILFKESGSLLPIAEEMIPKFDLPIQNNCLTLLLIYIQTNKAKIRSKISSLSYALEGNELGEGKSEYRLKSSELTRIIDKIYLHGSNDKIWDLIENTMSLQVRNITKLFACIKGYGTPLYRKVVETGGKILQTIQGSPQLGHASHGVHEKLHSLENTYHIVSKLISSCKGEIKQFYFINKTNLQELMEENDFDNEEIEQIKKVPPILLRNREKLMRSQELIRLCETMFYFIKILRDHFQGKIEDKMFSKLIHYPKMIIEVVWFYVSLFAKQMNFQWTAPSQIHLFFEKHPFMGSYSFANLQEVFNLVLYFLNLESFCTDKFKQFFMPILMNNHKLAREISLRFKIPKVDEDINAQNILVTRKCSFDMAFYQVVGQAITVEFHEEEGSDHGGLVRELMIGWKGRGVGEEAFFIGKILGISFQQGIPYGGAMDLGMFIALTNSTPTLAFFEDTDPEIYKSLVYIRDNDPTDLSLKFTIEKVINGKSLEFQLVEGGRDMDLTEENKQQYLEAYTRKYYSIGREQELQDLKTGFNTVVYPDYAEIFTPIEMLKQIRGEEIVDVKMLVSKAKYEGFSEESAVIKWFWSIVEEFNQERMNSFIQFVTGSPKITVYNSNFSITIEKVFDVNCLPVAHTCFNTLDLPEYSTREILEKKLITAICEGNNSFGIL